eukprot:scaffold39511_cov168-Skeletonema_marinoi.AAC.3
MLLYVYVCWDKSWTGPGSRRSPVLLIRARVGRTHGNILAKSNTYNMRQQESRALPCLPFKKHALLSTTNIGFDGH